MGYSVTLLCLQNNFENINFSVDSVIANSLFYNGVLWSLKVLSFIWWNFNEFWSVLQTVICKICIFTLICMLLFFCLFFCLKLIKKKLISENHFDLSQIFEMFTIYSILIFFSSNEFNDSYMSSIIIIINFNWEIWYCLYYELFYTLI